ncbi:MAG: glycosyltransferase [Candidatus Magasanikbacteria bacterium]
MKVCLINNLYGNNAVGGAEKVIQVRALEYKKKGDNVFIITSKASKSPKIEKSNENGIVIYRVWMPNIFYYKDLSKHGFVLKLIWHFIDVFGSAKVIERVLTEEKPDVVETHNLMGITFSQKFIKSKSQKSVIWRHFLHDVQLVEPSGVLVWNHVSDNLMQKIYSGIMKRKFKGVDEVISPSEFLRDFYFKRGFFENSEWNIDKMLGTGRDLPVQRSQHLPNSKFLFVGSLVKHKGVRILMQAWDKRYGGGEGLDPPVHDLPALQNLHIVGDGILRDEVEKWASGKSNVKVYGRLEGEELENIYKNCDILIFPSICIENNPTVIHEAHEHGLRVIASNTGGVGEIVFDGDVLVEPGNVEELISSI